MTPYIAVAALLASSPDLSGHLPGPPDVYAIIVANNHSVEGELASLNYADDDGARWFELLDLGAAKVNLLSVLDEDTQSRHPRAAEWSVAPNLRELDRALEETFTAIKEAERRGQQTAFYFIYVGHGSLEPKGGAAMHLLDGYLSRRSLFQKVIKASPANVNHIIIDACHAYLMVAARGGRELDELSINQATRQFLSEEDLRRYPNTGVLLATSTSKEVHEWSRFRAGIFSHEVRSALTGAADVDGDQRLTYDEVHAFVAAANTQIENTAARLEVYARPPKNNFREPFFSRRWFREAPTLLVPEPLAGRWWLEDSRGVRFADFHSARDARVLLTLVPQQVYFLRNTNEEIRIPIQGHQMMDASMLGREAKAVATRGSEGFALEAGLFAEAFGVDFYKGFLSGARRSGSLDSYPPPFEKLQDNPWSAKQWASTGFFAGAVGASVAGIALVLESRSTAREYREHLGSEAGGDELRSRARTQDAIGKAALGVSGVLMSAGFLSLTW